MAFLLTALQFIVGIASLVCFIMVLIKMFQEGQTGLFIACIVLLFCFGIGFLVAFIMGWVNSTRWGIKNIMIAWTGCIVLQIILNIAAVAAGATMFPQGG